MLVTAYSRARSTTLGREMNRMPSQLKWIIGLMLLSVVMQFRIIGMYGASATVIPRLFHIVITLGIAKGLAEGTRGAWYLGRILNLLGLILGVLMILVALVAQFSGISRLTFLAWSVIALVTSAFIFFALGSRDIRMFCGLRKRRKQTQQSVGERAS